MNNIVWAFTTEKKLKEQIRTLDQTTAQTDEEFARALLIKDELLVQAKPLIKEQRFITLMALAMIPLFALTMTSMFLVLFKTAVGLAAFGIGTSLILLSVWLGNYLARRINKEAESVYVAAQHAEDDSTLCMLKEDFKMYLARKTSLSMLVFALAMIGALIIIMAPLFISWAQIL